MKSDSKETGLTERLKRTRWAFHLMIGSSVVVISFVYGLCSGLERGGARAVEAALYAPPNGDYQSVVPDGFDLPDDLQIVPIGQDTSINGRRAKMVSFVTSRDVKSLLAEQVERWQTRGLTAFGGTSDKKGIAVAVDPQTGVRYTMSASLVPKPLRSRISQGYAVVGNAAVSGPRDGEVLNEEEAKGLVPDVPLMPGGRAGAVWSSEEDQGRGYSGAYTNPGQISENVDFYRSAMQESGWKLSAEHDASQTSKPYAQLGFRRGSQELVLIFVPTEDGIRFSPKGQGSTLVTIALSPQPFDVRG